MHPRYMVGPIEPRRRVGRGRREQKSKPPGRDREAVDTTDTRARRLGGSRHRRGHQAGVAHGLLCHEAREALFLIATALQVS